MWRVDGVLPGPLALYAAGRKDYRRTMREQPDLISLGRELERAAEPGFFETRTHGILADRFRRLGFHVQEFEGMPGFAATVDGTMDGKTVAVLADMDGLPHGSSWAHLCGHHQQMVALLGAAAHLGEEAPEVLARIAFVATPAEEFVDLERREELRKKGRIRRLSGKQELLDRGFFRGFRRVLATHAARLETPDSVSSVQSMNGFDVMRFSFRGVSAHAGASPHLGRNAQNAASLFLQACAFLRETFDEEKHVRIHPVMHLAPDQAVNLVPDAAFVETYVRAVEPSTIAEISDRLQAAATGTASALGVHAAVERVPGYAPFRADPALRQSLRDVASARGMRFVDDGFSAASSDMGDVSAQVPSVIVGLPGTNGLLHNPDFRVTDEHAAYVVPASVVADLARAAALQGPG